jgi:hypothetical protein
MLLYPKKDAVNIHRTFAPYLSSILQEKPVPPPKVSHQQWEMLIDVLGSQGIMPLLYWRISRMPAEFHPPEDIMGLLRKSFMESRVRVFMEDMQLRELVDTFHEANVDFLVLKGPALGRMVYPDPALRPRRDLDILVKPAQFEHAVGLLEGLGYAGHHNYDFHEQFRHAESNRSYLPVELHWGFIGFPYPISSSMMEGLFQAAVTVEAAGFKFRSLNHVDAINFAAVHMIRHRYMNRLIWLNDLQMLMPHFSIPDDWMRLQKVCTEWGSRMALERAITGTEEWTGLTLPEGFRDFSLWPAPAEIEVEYNNRNRCTQTFQLNYQNCSSKCSFLRYLYCRYFLQESRTERFMSPFRFLFRLIFPSWAYMRGAYPVRRSWMLPVSYVRRWLYWFGMICRWLLRSVNSDMTSQKRTCRI